MIMMFVWFLDSRSSTAYDNDVRLVLRQQQFNSLVQQLMIMMFVWFLDSSSSTAYDNDVSLVLRQQFGSQFNSL